MKIAQRMAFGACGAVLLILPDFNAAWMEIAFRVLGVAYILVALWWPQPKNESREDIEHTADDNGS